VSRFWLIQPHATASAAERKSAVLLLSHLLIYFFFILQADISAVAAQIFAILVSVDQNLLQF